MGCRRVAVYTVFIFAVVGFPVRRRGSCSTQPVLAAQALSGAARCWFGSAGKTHALLAWSIGIDQRKPRAPACETSLDKENAGGIPRPLIAPRFRATGCLISSGGCRVKRPVVLYRPGVARRYIFKLPNYGSQANTKSLSLVKSVSIDELKRD